MKSCQTHRSRNIRLSLAVAMMAFFLVPFAIAPTSAAGQTEAVRQYDVVDLKFTATKLPTQPIDATFSATFENDSGSRVTAPGFFNGGNEYVIRFTPPESGKWTYTTQSSLAELNGKSKTLSIEKATKGRKGGIIIDPTSSTKFAYKDGDAYYPIAFEVDWLFALDAENDSDIPKSKKFIDQIAASGFNQVVMNVFAYDVKWKKDEQLNPEFDYGSPKVFPFGGDNTAPDYSKLDIEYFQRLDRVIAYLDSKGVAAHLMIYVWNKQVSWPEAGSEEDNRYFDYVVNRYQAYPNIVWDISKEALGYGHTDVNYITERIKRLRKLDHYNRLVTVHDYGYCRRFKENVDFISVQLWLSELYSVMRNVRQQIPGKPILNIEHGGYEKSPYVVFNGNYTSPEVCLERAYQCVFAGTYPTHYWQGAAWNVIIPDIESLPAESRPKLEYYRHMSKLIQRYGLNDLKAGDKKSNAGFCLHNEQNLYIYYVPRECDFIGLRLPKSTKGQMMKGIWFNPIDGSYSKPDEQVITQWPAFTVPEGDQFWILICEIQPKVSDQ